MPAPSANANAAAVVLQQILPLFVLFALPLFALRLFAFVRPRAMALGALLPWNWGPHSEKERESGNGKSLKRRVRTRAEQVAEAQSKKEKEKSLDVDDTNFPGLVNMSGTHCFMNSTLQVCASFSAEICAAALFVSGPFGCWSFLDGLWGGSFLVGSLLHWISVLGFLQNPGLLCSAFPSLSDVRAS
ncbi:hypothetical protein B0H12DRAFT_1125853 [Mycena haematopus]|nr:hypothetical protein B0H12DRAFT_1125853 [Mycena haematopus]